MSKRRLRKNYEVIILLSLFASVDLVTSYVFVPTSTETEKVKGHIFPCSLL